MRHRNRWRFRLLDVAQRGGAHARTLGNLCLGPPLATPQDMDTLGQRLHMVGDSFLGHLTGFFFRQPLHCSRNERFKLFLVHMHSKPLTMLPLGL